jgi:hypothetical protein
MTSVLILFITSLWLVHQACRLFKWTCSASGDVVRSIISSACSRCDRGGPGIVSTKFREQCHVTYLIRLYPHGVDSAHETWYSPCRFMSVRFLNNRCVILLRWLFGVAIRTWLFCSTLGGKRPGKNHSVKL